ncbi:hypothetical protein N7493_005102 [Penicillium malachiteum]|uniref:Uncharacterized protein n=1 Tax=Penicillium malachiteum TaxID=1324776 RepID=A0AAD6HMD0_9EURO|nr:hypothetical protein N7493_005102 [Penicillium malachiteum]
MDAYYSDLDQWNCFTKAATFSTPSEKYQKEGQGNRKPMSRSDCKIQNSVNHESRGTGGPASTGRATLSRPYSVLQFSIGSEDSGQFYIGYNSIIDVMKHRQYKIIKLPRPQ